jgi:hypothetical protein
LDNRLDGAVVDVLELLACGPTKVFNLFSCFASEECCAMFVIGISEELA